MDVVEMLERRRHLPQHDVGITAVHSTHVIALERVHEALSHAIGLRAAHRCVDWLDAQVLD